MKRTILTALAVLSILLAGSSQALAATEHCPDHNGNPNKVEGANNSVVLPAGTVFCVKGSTTATGYLTADGTTDLFTYLGIGKDVSYYVTYPAATPTPEPTATPEPTVAPTPSVTMPPTDTVTTMTPSGGVPALAVLFVMLFALLTVLFNTRARR